MAAVDRGDRDDFVAGRSMRDKNVGAMAAPRPRPPHPEGESVTAPRAALPTARAYFASTPRV